jgi:hypothetical protein
MESAWPSVGQDVAARMMRTWELTTRAAIVATMLALGVGQAMAGQGKEQRIAGAALVARCAGRSTTVAMPFAMEGGEWRIAR